MNDNVFIMDVGFGCENERIDQGRSYLDKIINISDCFFSRNSIYSGYGGIIHISVTPCTMNINYSMFYNCICSFDGGAIIFSSTNSYLRMICVNRCLASSWYHFAWIKASQANHVEYLSITNCSHTTSGYYPIGFDNGNQRVDNTNISMNNAYQGSGIHIFSPSLFTSSHCTFSNNKVIQSICILLHSISGIISMSHANIVHNNSPADNGVVHVYGVGTRQMKYCIFQNNQNYLFCVYSGSLEVSHSFIDHSGPFSRSRAVSTTNNSLTKRITYQMQFFNSLHCNADIPIIMRETAKETIARTYDIKCDLDIMTRNRLVRNSDNRMYMYPIIIAFIIV